MGVEIRRGSARFTERVSGRATRHSFSFGQAYDPDNTGFGPMTCHDEHLLGRGEGFATHRHSDLVIVSWVVSGALVHEGAGDSSTVRPGEVAVLHTGAGTEHSEVAAEAQTRFVQVWLAPDEGEGGAEPSYTVTPAALVDGELVEVARPTSTATLSVARLEPGQAVTLPQAPRLHVFVARGALVRSSMAEPLEAGDAFRIVHEAGDPTYDLTAAVATELLVWSLA